MPREPVPARASPRCRARSLQGCHPPSPNGSSSLARPASGQSRERHEEALAQQTAHHDDGVGLVEAGELGDDGLGAGDRGGAGPPSPRRAATASRAARRAAPCRRPARRVAPSDPRQRTRVAPSRRAMASTVARGAIGSGRVASVESWTPGGARRGRWTRRRRRRSRTSARRRDRSSVCSTMARTAAASVRSMPSGRDERSAGESPATATRVCTTSARVYAAMPMVRCTEVSPRASAEWIQPRGR